MAKREAKVTQQTPVAWEALEDAFENNAPEVHSYLNTKTGDVIRIVDGVADPNMHSRIMNDPSHLRVDPVSSREQYRWMERYIATVDDPDFRARLTSAIDGKGAFRRFKDVLMSFPVDRERWFAFRSERLRTAMETWLEAHGIEPVEREKWEVPTAEQVQSVADREERSRAGRRSRVAAAESARKRLHELVDLLPVRELDMALVFIEFLRERRPTPRTRAKGADDAHHAAGSAGEGAATHDPDQRDADEDG